ncbi:MAG: tRNA 2-thiouridine(34) synthase MnmA [Ignavibacteria bacterium]|nr:tRNA 2-thiouridine(34) synthase MnmA [Ignavibacteria bacterium]
MKVAVLLSGGVDSSVALRLLQEDKHDITAFYLKIWLQDEFSFLGNCPWEEDLEYARGVCEQAGVPLEIIPLQDEYWSKVVSYAIREIKEGRTPNPDMFCNSLIKFGEFFNKISPDYEKVASGHYANLIHGTNSLDLQLTPDPIKDQTYFLAYLTRAQLGRALFPIGNYDKKGIRRLAKQYNLPNKDRKDSQGVCFLGKIKFRDFIKFHLGELPGDIVNIDTGKIMGRHPGYYYYTIGQRSGIGLHGGPWYVIQKDIVKNIVYISGSADLLEREQNSFRVAHINWINKPDSEDSLLRVKIRHGARFFDCRLTLDSENSGNVQLQGSDKGIAAGQFAVFYNGLSCLGGGIIDTIDYIQS